MSAGPAVQSKYLSRQYIDGVYIPSGLLIVGCLIVKREWLPFSVAIALILGGWKVYNSRTFSDRLEFSRVQLKRPTEVRKVLKPDVFQDFELKEKTIISHNVAMYVPSPIRHKPP
jgi:cytochrome-b5 reductase